MDAMLAMGRETSVKDQSQWGSLISCIIFVQSKHPAARKAFVFLAYHEVYHLGRSPSISASFSSSPIGPRHHNSLGSRLNSSDINNPNPIRHCRIYPQHTGMAAFSSEALSRLSSEDQLALLDSIDRLRLQGINNYVSLPQIIVCGDQSSGKALFSRPSRAFPFPSRETCALAFQPSWFCAGRPTSAPASP
jgi:hypothetical protein